MGTHLVRPVLLLALALSMFASCKDDGKPAPDAAPLPIDSSVDAMSACGGTTAYLQACTMNENCISCACQSFGHSMVCTQACTGPADCPAPSGGCTNGFCRP